MHDGSGRRSCRPGAYRIPHGVGLCTLEFGRSLVSYPHEGDFAHLNGVVHFACTRPGPLPLRSRGVARVMSKGVSMPRVALLACGDVSRA